MNFTLFIILIVVFPIVVITNGNRLKHKPKLNEILIVGSILLAIFLAFFISRVYVIEKIDGEYTYHTNVYLWNSTYETDEGKKIKISPSYFRCGILNLSGTNLKLEPKQYGRYRKAGLKKYHILNNTYKPTKEWNIDVFPPDHAPSTVKSQSKNKTIYVLSTSYK